jgi:hypothetical protein
MAFSTAEGPVVMPHGERPESHCGRALIWALRRTFGQVGAPAGYSGDGKHSALSLNRSFGKARKRSGPVPNEVLDREPLTHDGGDSAAPRLGHQDDQETQPEEDDDPFADCRCLGNLLLFGLAFWALVGWLIWRII